MLRMRNVCSVAVLVSGLALAGGVLAQGVPQGMPMGTMKTTPDPTYGPN